MSTLSELALEYRQTAAQMALAIERHSRAGDLPPGQLAQLRHMLEELRTTQRTLSGYYDLPRPGVVDASSWTAGKGREDDH